MAFDGFITGAMAVSLNSELADGKIDKIFQPDKNDLVLHIHRNKDNYRLLISANSSHPRLYILPDDYVDDNPKTPPAFAMLMRKHFRGGRIEEIAQYQSERIIEIRVAQRDELGYPENKKIIIEIMGKHSNIIALNADKGIILDSIKRIPQNISRYRTLLPGVEYVYPPDQGKIPFYDLSSPSSILTDKFELLSEIQGISPSMAQEIVAISGLEGKDVVSVLKDFEKRILNADFRGLVYEDETGFPVDFHIFNLPEKASVYKEREFPDLNSCLLYYYSHKDSGNRMKQKTDDLQRHIGQALDKLYLKKQKLEADLSKAKEAEKYRLYGELLTASLHSIEKGADAAKVLNYYDNEHIIIPLDPRFSPAINAKNYYKKFNKAKTAQKEKKVQIDETDKGIAYLEASLVYAENAGDPHDLDAIREELIEEGFLRRRQKKQPISQKPGFLEFSPSPGVTIRIGRNNKENEFLTFKQAGKRDLWFHAKDVPGSHVLLSVEEKIDVKELAPEVLEKAASLAAYYSKARNATHVPVDFTYVSQVKKIPGAKPGMVSYRNQKTLLVNPQDFR